MWRRIRKLFERKPGLRPGDMLSAITDTSGAVGDPYRNGMGPAMRMYLNRPDRYTDPHYPIEGWH